MSGLSNNKSDTELTLNGDVIANIKAFATGNTEATGVYAKTDANQYAYARITDGTTAGVITTGTIKGLYVVLSDGTTVPTVTTGTIKALNTAITDGTTTGIIKAGNSFAVADVALGVSDANVLAAISVPTALVGGVKTVTTAGVRVALGASTPCKSVYIRANAANTGIIYVGGVTVTSANGIALGANDSMTIDIANLATVYIDSSVSLEGVGYLVMS